MRAYRSAPAAVALREQAVSAVCDLVQALLDEPRNEGLFARSPDRGRLAERLFEDALIVVYRLLFLFQLEASRGPGRSFGFASTDLWRKTCSPTHALASAAERHLAGEETHARVSEGLRALFRMFREGRQEPGMRVPRLGGRLFGAGAAPLLDDPDLFWSERAAARLLDHLLWIPDGKNGERRRIEHGSLCVEDLGRVYEGLLELAPGIAAEPMCRLRRQKLEVVVPIARAALAGAERREAIPEGAFYLRAGSGRKASGSYYTPPALVKFLIRETLGPQIDAVSPGDAPNPEAILGLKVLDPAMGSGHFLVEACRFLADAVVTAWTQRGELHAIAREHGEPLSHARRLVASLCLYGVDKDPMAVLLAKLSLWLESCAEELPLTFLDEHLLCGDALTGPFLEKLSTLPSGAEGWRGDSKPPLDLARWKVLAAAWSGAVMLGENLDDDYRALWQAARDGSDIAAVMRARPALSRAVEIGREGVSYDLVFPEVLRPEGPAGFHAVVGNPPWDAVRRDDDQFFAGFDLGLLDLPTKAEKRRTIDRLLGDEKIAGAYRARVRGLERKDRIVDALYSVHKARVLGALAGRGTYDEYMLFAERAASLLAPGTGRVGMIFPSAFHANEGAVGVRRLYLQELRLTCCFSFENRRKLFEIDGRFKFALVVARSGAERTAARCAFYLQDPSWLPEARGALEYGEELLAKTGGEHLSLLELRSPADMAIAERCFDGSEPLGAVRARLRILTSQEVNMTYDSHRFTAASRVVPDGRDPRDPRTLRELHARGYLPLHEGKTFHQYTDRWEDRPRYVVALSAARDRPGWTRASRFFRLAFRDIASSTNERTAIFAVLPPGVLCGNKAPCEREPFARPSHASLHLLAITNTFSFDHLLRFRVQSTVNLFLLDACPVPPSAFAVPRSLFLAHSALRLSCNHEGYLPLWQEQLGSDTWRENTPVYSWPVLADDEARWAVRAATDAVVAEAYGLSREQYAHVLSSFKHRSHPDAPSRCLAAFDELASVGLGAFTRKHDPYWDIPLVETLPTAVIDLPDAPSPPNARR